jgi:hypothetical protein
VFSFFFLSFQDYQSSELVKRRKRLKEIRGVTIFWDKLYQWDMHDLLFLFGSTENYTGTYLGTCLGQLLIFCHTRVGMSDGLGFFSAF